MSKKILCMGSINMDMVMYMERTPALGETVMTDNFHTFCGGKGSNQAAAAGKLGADVRIFSKLGDDLFSKQLLEDLKQSNVDIEYMLTSPQDTAGIALILVNKSGQNSIAFTPGANGKLSPQDVYDNKHIFDDCDILLIAMELSTETVYAAVSVAKEKGLIVVLDPAPAPVNGIPFNIAELIDYIKPNETEAEILCGVCVNDIESAKVALHKLREMGFATPIITLSKNGAVFWNGKEPQHVLPLKVDSVDSTGAGDIFLGAFVTALAEEKELLSCLEYAKTVAAISTTKKGAQASIPTKEEVEKYLERGR